MNAPHFNSAKTSLFAPCWFKARHVRRNSASVAKGGHLEGFAASRAQAFGHLGHQKYRLQTDGHGLQFTKTTALAGDGLAGAGRALYPVGPNRKHEADAAVLVQRLDVIVAFPHSKRMV